MKKLLSSVLFVFICILSLIAPTAKAADSDWKALSSGTAKELSAISCPEPRVCYVASGLYAIGGTGSVIKTEDGGDTWKELTIPSSSPLHGISCASAQACFAAGDFGTILKTADGGASWSEIVLGSKSDPPHFTNVFAIDAERAIVIGKDGLIFRTADGGAHFAPPSFRSFADFYGIYFSDSSNGYIVGNGGVLLKTSDSGESWLSRGSLRDAGSLFAIRGAKGALIAAGDGLYRSTDNGETWTRQVIGLSQNYRSAALFDEKEAYVIFDSSSVAKTTDGGGKWEPHLASGAYLRSIVCPGNGYCIVVGGFGKAFRLGTPPAAPPPPPQVPPPPPPAPTPVATSTPPSASVSTAPVVAPVTPPAVTPASAVAAPAAPAEPSRKNVAEAVKTALDSIFRRTLKKGASGDDVEQLQEILASVAGVYPDGEVTGYFGAATAKAVGRFQEKFGLATQGDAGYGQVGPKTRVKLIEAARGDEKGSMELVPAAKSTPERVSSGDETRTGSPERISGENRAGKPLVIARLLKKGSRGEDVRKLQEFLLSDTEISAGVEASGYFGPATAKAVGRFQEKYGIAVPDDAGYGEAGPKTRAKLKELSQ